MESILWMQFEYTTGRIISRSCCEKPSLCSILICFSIVLFPLSPAPGNKALSLFLIKLLLFCAPQPFPAINQIMLLPDGKDKKCPTRVLSRNYIRRFDVTLASFISSHQYQRPISTTLRRFCKMIHVAGDIQKIRTKRKIVAAGFMTQFFWDESARNLSRKSIQLFVLSLPAESRSLYNHSEWPLRIRCVAVFLSVREHFLPFFHLFWRDRMRIMQDERVELSK